MNFPVLSNYWSLRFLALAAILIPNISLSLDKGYSLDAKQREQLRLVSTQPVWKKLLGYQGKKSSVVSKHFFLSPQGQVDPFLELAATVNAFSKSVDTTNDEHAQCKFRGRYIWLSRQINFENFGVLPIECPEFDEFSYKNQISSISLIFATGYLSNPASFYGHLLVKLDIPASVQQTQLTDYAVNYGAAVPDSENMLVYIVKRITGGYTSTFTKQEFFHHLHNYSDEELRDIWEYQLDLDRNDTQLVVAHLWEMLNIRHKYYFFNRNCAYRVGELLELITEDKLIYPSRPWEIPQAILQRLESAEKHGKPLVKKINFIPSRQNKFYQRFVRLSKENKNFVKEIVENTNQLNSAEFSSLSLKSKYVIIDTLIDYYKYLGADIQKQSSSASVTELKKSYRAALLARFQLPPSESENLFTSKNQPHLGHRPSYSRLSFTHHKDLGGGISINLRPAYYDALDSDRGQTKFSGLSMGELEVAVTESDTYIKNLKLVQIESVPRNVTHLAGDSANSWGISVGFEQTSLECIDCLGFSSQAKTGYSKSFIQDRLLVTGLVGGGFLNRKISSEGLYGVGEITFNLELKSNIRVQLKNTFRSFFNTGADQKIFELNSRIPVGQQKDFRIYYKHEEAFEFGIGLGHYW